MKITIKNVDLDLGGGDGVYTTVSSSLTEVSVERLSLLPLPCVRAHRRQTVRGTARKRCPTCAGRAPAAPVLYGCAASAASDSTTRRDGAHGDSASHARSGTSG